MDRSHKNTAALGQESPPEDERELSGERRRLSRYRHDDRGNGYVEWIDAPAELVGRPKLEVQPDGLQLEEEAKAGAYDPYANAAGGARKTGNTTRTDLRKLSEWIKMMRELEERKRNQDEGEEEE